MSADLITKAELAAALRLPVADIDDDEAASIIADVGELIREETGQRLDFVADEVITLRSTGGRCILLPELPVVAVTLVRVKDSGGTWRELEADVDYEVELGRAGALWRTSSRLNGFFLPAGEWPRGEHRGPRGWVEVTHSHGYATVDEFGSGIPDGVELLPGIVKTVAKRVGARGYVNPEAVAQESSGNRTTVYGDAPGLYLSKRDQRDLNRLRPGNRGGSR